MSRFEIFRNVNNEYSWRLRAANGEIIASGEEYVTKEAARRAVERVIKLATQASVRELT
jgi:uncharacterized protein YegP (UPF0339 family)